MKAKQNTGGLDIFRLAAAFLVVAIHTSPLISFSAEGDFFLTRVLARTAVPFFFMVTGQFVLSDSLFSGREGDGALFRQVKKLALLYGLSILLYLPVGIYAGHYQALTLSSALRMLLIDGTFYHLWYFPACITGLLLVWLLRRFLPLRAVAAAAGILYLIGLLGDSYYGLIVRIPVLSGAYDAAFQVFSYTRNGFFLAPVFLILGAVLGRRKNQGRPALSAVCLAVSLALMTAEAFLLRHFALQRHDSMYVFLVPAAYFLYRLLLSLGLRPWKAARPLSTGIYVLHPLMIVGVRGAAKLTGLTGLLVGNSLIHYAAVCGASLAASACLVLLTGWRKRPVFSCGRAWIELDRDALRHNVEVLRALLPQGSALMPAVKANAYGHGAVPVARELNRMGIRSFCVATVAEGRELRCGGVRGEILALGYTHPRQFPLLRRYRLSQTVVDYAYALQLSRYGRRLRVHVGVDSGMHRLGERCEQVEKLARICRMKHLKVVGLFTHLCADDTHRPEDEAFTRRQLEAFYGVVRQLEERGIPRPRLHVLSSYGLLNGIQAPGQLVRVGIALYGMLSTQEDTQRCPVPLKPVLTLKARVAAVKTLHTGESAGYGRAFIAEGERRIAVLAIGYADGLPRSLSCGVGEVLIGGCRVPVAGRICMDQMTVDVTGVPDVQPGTEAVLIGRWGAEEITAGELAERTGTIANEILSRLGLRLERIVTGSSPVDGRK